MAMIDSHEMTQVSVGILPIGSSTRLLSIECATYHGGITRQLERDLRADTCASMSWALPDKSDLILDTAIPLL